MVEEAFPNARFVQELGVGGEGHLNAGHDQRREAGDRSLDLEGHGSREAQRARGNGTVAFEGAFHHEAVVEIEIRFRAAFVHRVRGEVDLPTLDFKLAVCRCAGYSAPEDNRRAFGYVRNAVEIVASALAVEIDFRGLEEPRDGEALALHRYPVPHGRGGTREVVIEHGITVIDGCAVNGKGSGSAVSAGDLPPQRVFIVVVQGDKGC